jgi:hypothetical protein
MPKRYETFRIFNATDPTEYLALSSANKDLYHLVISQTYADMSDDKNSKVILWALFPEGSVTRESLTDLIRTNPPST